MNEFRISRQEFNSLILINNSVIVKSIIDMSKIKLKNTNITLDIDVDYEKDAHSPRVLEVIRTPKDPLTFNKNMSSKTLSWKTNMELQKGDIVWVHSLAVIYDEYSTLVRIIVDDDVYFIINYEDLIVAKRGDKIICLNGYVLIQPNLEDLQEKYKYIYVPTNLIEKKKIPVLSWTVKYVGFLNVDYKNPMKNDFDYDLKDGDIIYINKKRKPYPLENSLHRYFNNNEDYYFTQRCEIVAVKK
jgi:hypothetical protein